MIHQMLQKQPSKTTVKKAVCETQWTSQGQSLLLFQKTFVDRITHLLEEFVSSTLCIAHCQQASFRPMKLELNSQSLANRVECSCFATFLCKNPASQKENQLHATPGGIAQRRFGSQGEVIIKVCAK